MEITETLYVTSAKEWRSWLSKNCNKKSEIWLEYPHKASGKPRIVYNDAVEQALCFGWIDSTIKNFGEASAQRFTPRRKGSPYSQMNKERLLWLREHKQIAPHMHDAVEEILAETYVLAPDIVAEIKKNPDAWRHWKTYAPSYHRIRVWYVDDYRSDPEKFKKSLSHLIKKTAAGKQYGYGGIEKYF